MTKPPLRIGHRGAAGHAPENTILSVETALSLGVDVVEVDVHLSRDGHLIVMHDERVDRTTNGIGYIRDLTLNEIQSLQTRSRQPVPTLQQVLEAVRGKAALMIEFKVSNIALAVLALTACVPEIPILFASFFHAELLTVRKFDPAATTIALLDAVPVSREAFAVDAAATYAGISFSCLDKFFVRDFKNAGLGVLTFTLNEPRDIAYACSLEVDAIVSDFPDRLPASESRT